MKRLYFYVLLHVIVLQGLAQDSLSKVVQPENYISLNYDNDFFSATDRYYTQGIILSIIHPLIKKSPLHYALLKLNKQAINYYGLHLEQDVFTPKSIRHNEGNIFYDERPFSALFLLSHSISSLNINQKIALHSQLDLGMIGPIAKGEEEQKGIHKALDNIEPLGWQNQLANDYIINYRIKLEKGIYNSINFQAILVANARLGSLYTDGSVGFHIRCGIFSNYFTNLGLEKTSSIRKHNLKLYIIAKANGKLVAYNATLQGGLFNSNNIYTLSATQINRTIFDCVGGIVVAYKNVSLEYSRFYITPEFKKGVDHGWGRIAITVAF